MTSRPEIFRQIAPGDPDPEFALGKPYLFAFFSPVARPRSAREIFAFSGRISRISNEILMCHYKATEGPNGQVTYKSQERPHSRTDNVHAIRRQKRRIEEGCGAYGD